jgi:hypothetical protein
MNPAIHVASSNPGVSSGSGTRLQNDSHSKKNGGRCFFEAKVGMNWFAIGQHGGCFLTKQDISG